MLEPVFQAEGGTMPNPEHSTAAVAFDEQGLAGFWTLQQMLHAGPLWIRPDCRGTRLWQGLHEKIDALFERKPGTGYYSFAGEPRMEAVFKRLGYQDLNYKVFKREL